MVTASQPTPGTIIDDDMSSHTEVDPSKYPPDEARRRLIVCLDGTWDTPSAQTNTYRFYKCIQIAAPFPNEANTTTTTTTTTITTSNSSCCSDCKTSPELWVQIAGYFPGVAAEAEGLKKYIGGAFGLGISDQIMGAYEFLSMNYRDDKKDEIWLIGASRGAYAARSLAGMIDNVGLLPCKNIKEAGMIAYRLYHDRSDDRSKRKLKNNAFRKQYQCWDPKIRFLGCFDTVGSLGVPKLPWYLGGSLLYTAFHNLHRFHDATISRRVQSAFHAIAIHEQRKWFNPTVMTLGKGMAPNQELEEIWFPGNHSDVIGGPGASEVLSNHVLQWMLIKAQDRGLMLRRSIPEVCGPQGFSFNDSYKAEMIYRLMPRTDRFIDPRLFPSVKCLYLNGQFDQYLTPDQLALYPSKTVENFKNSLRVVARIPRIKQ
ncbi:hypothetical protein BX666DRAFT_1949772 [Dichotomocladium elegans]|nr:hypothetical protein BX666DRAFT_1949772 [Dichotomocladium elegans]